MKTKPVVLFLLMFVLLFSILSLWTLFQGKKEEQIPPLRKFRSDFLEQADKDALIDEIIAKKRRFIAYGNYVEVPAGEYVATFRITSTSPEQSGCQLQISAERGKTIIANQDILVESFPVSKDLIFKTKSNREIEPRIMFASGNQKVELEKVEIRKIKDIFPWMNILLTSLLFATGCALVFLAILFSFQESPKWKFYLAGFLFLAGGFLILWKAWISEDAFITLRHVDNFLHGYGPVFNVGERVEGFTHPLWFAILAFFRWIGFSPKGAAVFPALLASITALYILFFKIRIKNGQGAPSFLNPAAAVLIGMSAFIDFGTSGLETALSYLLLVLYAKFILEDRWQKQPIMIGLITSCLVLTRPDFGIFFILIFGTVLYAFATKKISKKHVGQFLIFPGLLVGGYQIFRMGYYASLLPNPFYAKSGSGSYWSQGLKYLGDLFQGSLVPLILFLAILMFLFKNSRVNLKNRLLVLLSGLLHGFFVVRGGGDFMHGRFLIPAILLITLSQTGVFDRLLEKKPGFRITCTIVCLAFFFSSLYVIPIQKRGQPLHNNITDERFFYYKDNIIPIKHLFTDTMIMIWKTIGVNYQNLSEKAKMNVRIAYKNVGFTGFYAGPRIYVLDELGLNDPVVSRTKLTIRKRPGHEKNASFGYMLMRKLTFRKTPFPLWNQIAGTKYGILWDVSPKTLSRLNFLLNDDFKKNLDDRIFDYLEALQTTEIPGQAEFLFFLKEVWFPYAPNEHQQKFMLVYNQDIIDRFSESQKWVKENKGKIDIHLARIQGPLGIQKFLRNILYAVRTGFSLKFSPIGAVEE
jgi:arabinofuranosyltransferase